MSLLGGHTAAMGLNAGDTPTLVFGIGAQKAGTTWLYDWLSGRDDVHFPCFRAGDRATQLKEVHYFDKYIPDQTQRHMLMRKAIARQAARLAECDDALVPALIERLSGRLQHLGLLVDASGEDAAYRDWMTAGRSGERVAMDITPSYSLLDRSGFARMAALGRNTKFILLLRDPVARLWSSVRYGLRENQAVREDFADVAARRLAAELDQMSRNPVHRSNYRRTISELEAAVPVENVFYGFYEDLFTEDTTRAIADFLGIAHTAADFGKAVNASQSLAMPQELRRRALAQLQEQYEFAFDRFGARVPQKWHEAHGILSVGARV